jgi:hypothetical protein
MLDRWPGGYVGIEKINATEKEKGRERGEQK